MMDQTTRRELLVAGGFALLASASGVEPVIAEAEHADGMTGEEKANVKLLEEFFASLSKPDLDFDKLAAKYIAPKGQIRWWDDEPVCVGPEAAAANAKKSAGNDVRVYTKILHLMARGPLVATSRVDTVKLPGKPAESIKIAGVAIIKHGQFQEYCDYIVA